MIKPIKNDFRMQINLFHKLIYWVKQHIRQKSNKIIGIGIIFNFMNIINRNNKLLTGLFIVLMFLGLISVNFLSNKL